MKILCFGDSNTYGFDPRSYFGGRYDSADRWVDILSEKTGWKINNMGQNGLSIPSSDYETELYSKIFLREEPDLLVIMLGSNDLLQGLGADAVTGRMKRFINHIDIDKENILLVSPPHFKAGLWIDSDKTIEQSIALPAKYEILAQSLGIHFANPDSWNIPLCYDGVHFTASGHHIFAQGIYETINNF